MPKETKRPQQLNIRLKPIVKTKLANLAKWLGYDHGSGESNRGFDVAFGDMHEIFPCNATESSIAAFLLEESIEMVYAEAFLSFCVYRVDSLLREGKTTKQIIKTLADDAGADAELITRLIAAREAAGARKQSPEHWREQHELEYLNDKAKRLLDQIQERRVQQFAEERQDNLEAIKDATAQTPSSSMSERS